MQSATTQTESAVATAETHPFQGKLTKIKSVYLDALQASC